MSIAEEIIVELARQKLTHEQLAKAIGTCRSSLSPKLAGKRDFKYEEIVRIGNFLNTPASELVKRAEETQKLRQETKKAS